MKQNFDVAATLIPSSGGVFEVTVDGTKIYSKKETGQFPVEDDLINSLRS
ncbi:SelT/SelW/SelH family protein [Desulfuromonas acetoxidans]|nr:Rdx family protein [Desulfuromonas acetoxidans]NVD23565.1 SelT/SelW/SelH family protein [Desulfuromonas acetoxidans]NVE16050.1 SelT/SelW/SelH family protein [Desulfuromonas acetoxidans]